MNFAGEKIKTVPMENGDGGSREKPVIDNENLMDRSNFQNAGVIIGSDGKSYLLLVSLDLPIEKRTEILTKARRGQLDVSNNIAKIPLNEKDFEIVPHRREILFLVNGADEGINVIDLPEIREE